jgi:hypothetical protein
MLSRSRLLLSAVLSIGLVASSLGADLTDSLKKGTPELKSAGALAFGPDGVLFVGDPQGAAIFAIDTGDKAPAGGAIKVEKIDEKIAGMLGTDAKGILINSVAVNPASGNAYLSVSRGKGPDAKPAILRVDAKGKIEELSLKDVKFAKAELPNASSKNRQEAITGLAFLKDRVLVAGLSNEEFASRFRVIPYPFKEADKGAGVEIFHGSHGKLETASPVRTFVPYSIKGEDHILAAYTCTPLVKVPVAQLKPGEKVKGVTIAELGNRNRPLDMIVYTKDGKDYILMANSARGLMKITTEGIDKADGITSRIADKAGLTYQTIDAIKGVQHLAKLDKDNALVLTKNEAGVINLETVPLP